MGLGRRRGSTGVRQVDGRAVRIVDWEPEWPALFERERDRLASIFDGVHAQIEHIGSTSVRGLAAKPILDIGIGVTGLEVVEARIPDFEAIGYTYVPQYEDRLPYRRYFRRPADHPRTHHVHCLPLDNPAWRRHIEFRDRLRATPELVRAYAELKRGLAERHVNDREAYTEAKSTFIESVLTSDDVNEGGGR